MENKKYNIIVLIYLIFILFVIQISGILITYTSQDSIFYSKFLFYISVVGLLIYLFYKMNVGKLCIKDLAVIMFILFSFLSFYFAYDRYVALMGFIGRREGLYALVSYYVFFLVASTLRDKKCLKFFIIAFFVHVFIQIIYGLLQVSPLTEVFGIPIKFNLDYSFGLVGNSNFFSSLQTLLLGIALGIYMFDNKLFNIKTVLFLEISLIGLVLSGAMSGFVGFVMIFLLLLIYIVYLVIIKKKKIFYFVFKIGLLLVLFVWTMFILTNFFRNKYALDIFDLNLQTTQIAEEGFKDQNGTGRIYIWKVALKNAPKYLLTGIGIDQFFYINDGKIIYDPITGNAIDKAHNEYLQILLTEGIFKCITYIVFLLWIFFKGVYVIIKSKKIDPLLLGLFLSFTAYCVQAFFNISVTRVAPIFFIIGGLLLAQLEKKQEEFSN